MSFRDLPESTAVQYRVLTLAECQVGSGVRFHGSEHLVYENIFNKLSEFYGLQYHSALDTGFVFRVSDPLKVASFDDIRKSQI
jgi:hypothetical protein